jgi:hypothetical protein
MWIMTTIGFFSVVQKEGTSHLTVRARVGSDLDRLRERYLPGLSATKRTGDPGVRASDYPYRATVSHTDFAAAMSKMVADIGYANFKDEVERKQGHARESAYHDVWSVLSQKLRVIDKQERKS